MEQDVVKVLIVQTGSIEYVDRKYFERYQNEGLIEVPEEKIEDGQEAETPEQTEGQQTTADADAVPPEEERETGKDVLKRKQKRAPRKPKV